MKGDPDASEAKDVNKDIYGVRAYKSYFMFDDIFLALGAGITNLSPEKEGNITTTIEQTYSPVAPEIVKKGKISWIRHGGFTYGVIPQQTSGEMKWNREERAIQLAKTLQSQHRTGNNSTGIPDGNRTRTGNKRCYLCLCSRL